MSRARRQAQTAGADTTGSAGPSAVQQFAGPAAPTRASSRPRRRSATAAAGVDAASRTTAAASSSPQMRRRSVARMDTSTSETADAAAASANADDAEAEEDARPARSLQRGLKRKEASLEGTLARPDDVTAVLLEHRARKASKLRRNSSATGDDVVTPTDAGNLSPAIASSDGRSPKTARGRRAAGSALAASSGTHSSASRKKKPRLTLNAAAAAAAAAAVALGDQTSIPLPQDSASPAVLRTPSLLSQSLPFLLHMLDTASLLRSTRVSRFWHGVTQSPIVWNSGSALCVAPENLPRAAASTVLRHAKRLILGRTQDAPERQITRDVHLAGSLLAFSQISTLEVLHLRVARIFGLTAEFGHVGRTLTTLRIARDESLREAKQRRRQMQTEWAREDAEAEAAATAPSMNGAASADGSAAMDVDLPHASPVFHANLTTASSATAFTSSSSFLSPTRRLPSLYSFVSLLSLCPNLIHLTWRPTEADDFLHPNVGLRYLASLDIGHPEMRRVEREWRGGEEEEQQEIPGGLDAADGALPADRPSRLVEKSLAQISWLRSLPALSSLAWPGWSLANLRALTVPVAIPPPPVWSPSVSTASGMLGAGLAGVAATAAGGQSSSSVMKSASFGSAGGGWSEVSTVPSPLTAAPSLASPLSPLLPRRAMPPQVQRMDLQYDVLSDAHLAALSRLQSLISLSLTLCEPALTDSGLQSLCSLELLQHLEIKGVRGGAEGRARTSPGDRLDGTLPQRGGSVAAAAARVQKAVAPGFPPHHPNCAAAARPPLSKQPSTDTMVDVSGRMHVAMALHAPDTEEEDIRPSVFLRHQNSVMSTSSITEAHRMSAVRSASMMVPSEQEEAESGGEGKEQQYDSLPSATSATSASSANAVAPSGVPPSLGRQRSFADLEVVRLASLCGLRSLRLETLELGREGIHILFHSLTHLRQLVLAQMDMPSLHPLACLTVLRRLTFDRCTGMRDASLAKTLAALRELQEVRVLQCPGVTSDAVSAIVAQLADPSIAYDAPPRLWPHILLCEFEGAPVTSQQPAASHHRHQPDLLMDDETMGTADAVTGAGAPREPLSSPVRPCGETTARNPLV